MSLRSHRYGQGGGEMRGVEREKTWLWVKVIHHGLFYTDIRKMDTCLPVLRVISNILNNGAEDVGNFGHPGENKTKLKFPFNHLGLLVDGGCTTPRETILLDASHGLGNIQRIFPWANKDGAVSRHPCPRISGSPGLGESRTCLLSTTCKTRGDDGPISYTRRSWRDTKG